MRTPHWACTCPECCEAVSRDAVITPPEYQVGYRNGWDAALIWAGVPNE